MAEKSVRWNEPKKANFLRSRQHTQDEYVHIGRKRYAVREQPTWINCKLPKPPQYKTDGHLTQLNEESIGQIPSTTEVGSRISSPLRSSRSSSTRAYSAITRLSDARSSKSQASSINSSILQDLLSQNEVKHKNKGRDVLKQKVEQSGMTLSSPLQLSNFASNTTDTEEKSRRQTSSLKKFRISSAESTHRSPDVSIGLRHISALLRGQEQQPYKKQSQRRRSTSTLLSLTKITSDNIQRTRRQSEPAIITAEYLKDLGTRTPAPGEGYPQQRRRSSLSAPATIGTGSNSVTNDSLKKKKTRPLPQSYGSSPFADREWRPPTLQKFSVKAPWAPSQQTPRYFPKYSNLQDIHCRNPYLVPGSILYKQPTIVE